MTDFTMREGDYMILIVPVIDKDTGEGVPLAGATIRWQMAKNDKGPALVSKSLGNGIALDPDDDTRFIVTLDAADTEGRTGNFYHEAEIIDEDDHPSTVESGSITIERTIIKPAA